MEAKLAVGPGGEAGAAMDPQIFEQPPELKEWFDKHPTEETAQALTNEEKNKFILMYYSEEKNPDELVSSMIEEADKVLDEEIKKGADKAEVPSEPLIMSLLALSKAKVLDEMVEEVGKAYTERRKLIKGKEIDDKGVVHLTQLNLAKMAGAIQDLIMKQVEEEIKSRSFPVEKFCQCAAICLMNDIQAFIEAERIFVFRKAEEANIQDIKTEQLTAFVEASLEISEQMLAGKLDSSLVFIYPQLLADKLFNLTGLENETVVRSIRELITKNELPESLATLIIKEAYSVEKSKKKCHEDFQKKAEEQREKEIEMMKKREEYLKNMKDPMDDPSIKKMVEMGLVSAKDVEELAKMGPEGLASLGLGPPGMMPPGMMPPGMMPPGMGPGMMPPGMPQLSPEMFEQMMSQIPPEVMEQMMNPEFISQMMSMMPPGMTPEMMMNPGLMGMDPSMMGMGFPPGAPKKK
jgi:hypothetical protein